MELQFWAHSAFFLILFFFGVYSILDGFDLGIAMLTPFTKSQGEANKLISHITPFWDGNEVWLIIGAGFIFAAFPSVYGLILTTFYLPFMAIIAAYILRALSLEYSYHDVKRQRLWQTFAAIGSFVATLGGLTALGTLLTGLPLNDTGHISTRAGDWVSVFSLIFGITGCAALLWHGATFALDKAPSETLGKQSRIIWWGLIICGLAQIPAWIVFLPGTLTKPGVVIGLALSAIGIILSRVTLRHKNCAFRFSCLNIAGLWLSVAAALFPHVLVFRNSPQFSHTIVGAAAPLSTLKPLVIIGVVLIPIIFAYSAFTYRMFKNPINKNDIKE